MPSLTQRINRKERLAIDDQFPIRQQLLTADFNPGLHQTCFRLGKLPAQQRSVENGKRPALSLVFCMDVRQRVPLVVEKVQADDDALKQADGRHAAPPGESEGTIAYRPGQQNGSGGESPNAGDGGVIAPPLFSALSP